MRRGQHEFRTGTPRGFSALAWLYPAALLFFLPLLRAVAETDASWLFLPTFRHQIAGLQQSTAKEVTAGAAPSVISAFVARTPELAEKEKNLLVWRAATFPHQDFVRLMPQNSVFGWYAQVFDRPAEFQGLDLLLDLGVIDDADETFLNGTLIGKTGKVPGGSAWNTDRLYRVPAALISEKGNILASHVWSQWGLGGIVGPPVLKAALVAADTQWELAFIKDGKAPASELNRVAGVDAALALCFGGTAPVWQKAAMPWAGWKSWSADARLAVFRAALKLPEKSGKAVRFHSPVVLDIGPVFDVAAVFLNGRRVGLTGRFPEDGEPAFTEAARRGQYLIAPQDWNVHGDNRLTVVVHRERGVGGLPGVPGILLENPVKPLRRDPPAAECFASFDILHQSLRSDDAGQSLDEARTDNDLDQVWLLSHRAHLAWLRWLDGERNVAALDGVLRPIHEILTKYPIESPKQSAMQAFCRVLRLAEKDEALLAKVRHYFPDFSRDCAYLAPDRLTKGDWARNYGSDFHVLAAMGQGWDWHPGERPQIPYTLVIPGNRDLPRLWLARSQRELGHPDALLMPDGREFTNAMRTLLPDLPVDNLGLPASKSRRSSWWDDHGEMHPFDDAGPDLLLDIELPDGWRMVTLHHTDFDWRHTRHPRQQSLLLLDQQGRLQNAAWTGKTDAGVYQPFLISGKRRLQIRSNKHRGACVALSGFFMDCQPESSGMGLAALEELPPGLHAKARDFLTATGARRLRLALELLNMRNELLAAEAGMTGIRLFVAAADSAFLFEHQRECFISRVRGLSLEELSSLLEQLGHRSSCHPRWSFLVAARLFELASALPEPECMDCLDAIRHNSLGHARRSLRAKALALWKQRGLPETDTRFLNMQESLPVSRFICPQPSNSKTKEEP